MRASSDPRLDGAPYDYLFGAEIQGAGAIPIYNPESQTLNDGAAAAGARGIVCHLMDRLDSRTEARFAALAAENNRGAFSQSPAYVRMVERTRLQRYVYAWCEHGASGKWLLAGVMRLTSILPGRSIAVFSRGPMISDCEDLRRAIPLLVERLRQEGVFTLVINPYWLGDEAKAGLRSLREMGFREMPASERTSFDTTALVDLTPDESDILGSFKKRCRRSIANGLKRGLEIRPARDVSEAEAYLLVRDDMARRQGMELGGLPDLIELWRHIEKEGNGAFLVALIGGKVVGGDVSIREGKRAFGESLAASLEHPRMPRTANLNWAAMRHMKALGCTEFDLGGIDLEPEDGPQEVGRSNRSHFKRGFNPTIVPVIPPLVLGLLPLSHTILYQLRRLYRRSGLRQHIKPLLTRP